MCKDKSKVRMSKMTGIKQRDIPPQNESEYPYFTYIVSLIQVVCYILFVNNIITDDLFVFKPARRYEVWRYFTIAFVHAGKLDLIGNLVFQLIFGICLEKVYGWRTVSVIFFSGTFFGELLPPTIVAPEDYAENVGASSGIMALSAAYIASAIVNLHLKNTCVLLTAIVICFQEILMLSFKEYIIRHFRYVCSTDCPGCPFSCQLLLDGGISNFIKGVSLTSHSAGSIIGLLVGFAVVKPIGYAKPWKKTLNWYCSKIVVLILVSVTILNVLQQVQH